jgi:hypothetical protein
MNGKGWLVPDHALWLARMLVRKCDLESGRHLALDYRRGVHRRRMNAVAVMAPSRGPVIVGQQGAPMSELGSGRRHV